MSNCLIIFSLLAIASSDDMDPDMGTISETESVESNSRPIQQASEYILTTININ